VNEGYRTAHNKLFTSKPKNNYINQDRSNLIITPYNGSPIFAENCLHLEAEDAYIPLLRELEYVLCENILTINNPNAEKILPVMPRYRSYGKVADGDMYWENNEYHWKSTRRTLRIITPSMAVNNSPNEDTWLLSKTSSELIDHLVTRQSNICSDIFIYPPNKKRCNVIIFGITRDCTSTKESATVESELYAGQVLEILKQKLGINGQIETIGCSTARLIYPRVSFYDIELTKWAETTALLPSEDAVFANRDLRLLYKSSEKLPTKDFIPSITTDLRRKFVVLLIQYTIAAFITVLNLEPSIRQIISDILDSLIK